MAAIALVTVGLLAIVIFVLFGALLELYRDVRQLRDALGILDRPLTIDIGSAAHTSPSSYGLPAALDTAASAIVLFLSDSCATCRVLAAALHAGIPAGLCVVVEARDAKSANQFMEIYGLNPDAGEGLLCIDAARNIAGKLGLDITPAALRIENGKFAGATTVPSTRYLLSILPAPLKLNSRRAQSWSIPWPQTSNSHTGLASRGEPRTADS